MTSQLIRLSLSERPSSPVRAKVECYVTSLLARSRTAQPSGFCCPQALRGRHPWLADSLVEGGGVFTPVQKFSLCILLP